MGLGSLYVGFISILMIFLLMLPCVILIIVGAIRLSSPKHKTKKSSKILLIVGIALFVLPGIILGVGTIIQTASTVYSMNSLSLIEIWNKGYSSPSDACADAVEALLSKANANDKEGLTELFSTSVRSKEGFDSEVESFLASYPGNLSEDNFTSYNYETSSCFETYYFSCKANDEWYFITLTYCYANSSCPDDVGITAFYIENVNSYFVSDDIDASFSLYCNLTDVPSIDTCVIQRRPYTIDTPVSQLLTSDEMLDLSGEYTCLDEIIGIVGEPNIIEAYDAPSTDFSVYYILESIDGEPRYASFLCDAYGNFKIFYIFSDSARLEDFEYQP